MKGVTIGALVFGAVFGGALLGMLLKVVLPKHHLSADSKDIVKLGMGLIATMSALVLSLLINSAKSSYDTQNAQVRLIAADVTFLDRVLAFYGPEAGDARSSLRDIVAFMVDQMSSARPIGALPTTRTERLYDAIQGLSPVTEAQRTLRAQAVAVMGQAARTRWLLFEHREGTVPTPFVMLLTVWLTVIFASFGLCAPANGTVVATFLVGSLSVAGAMFLVLELDRPFGGLIRLSAGPLQDALALIGR
ncbi:MAG TPA: hypothetical protein VFW70_03125 [Methylomirabilota bacterium]|nr:hypothetical protein [Methylomirabilota bacterium]